jgi:hypothetical protein
MPPLFAAGRSLHTEFVVDAITPLERMIDTVPLEVKNPAR